ncbi:MAG TPA: choice-of-anchor X domain-containing protein [Phycisphaerales bacterium]|nr:choice-of-anchor X domain-containing protein [Phycisphaerales bacterium]
MKNVRTPWMVALAAGTIFAGSALAQPALDGDLGTLTAGTPAVINVPGVAANAVRWYKFTLPTAVRYQDLKSLDIWSFNSGTAQDTEITLWDSVGNRVATDDDDGNSLSSALSFGTGGGGFPTGTTTITANNGRDGDLLAAGDYYISVTYFNVVNGTTNWTVTTPGTVALTAFDITVSLKDITPVDPSGTVDMGTLGASDTKTASGPLASASVKWFKIVVPGASNAGGTFVDIDTEGSAIAPSNDTRIALYTPSGAPAANALFTTLQDDQDGSGSLSQLTFGLTSPARPAVGSPAGLAYNGRDGELRPGLYYIGVAGFGTSPSTTSTISGQNFGFTSTSTNSGTVTVNVNSQLPSVPATGTGTALSVVEGQSGLLRVTTAPGANPAATATGVVIDTTLIGGTTGVVLVDDGTNGDVTAGDGIFSSTITVNVPAQAAASLPFVVTDSIGRTSNGTLSATVTQSVSGACCATDNTCSITRTFLCTQAGGSFAGAGTDCGGILNYNQEAGTGTFTSIAATGTALNFATTVGGTANFDDGIAEVALPFPVNFYGSSVSTIRVVTNGFIHMNNTGTSTAFTNSAIPSTATPNGAVYPMWDDFALQNGTTGNVYVQTDGVAPNRTFTVSWENVGQYSFTTVITPIGSNNFQVVFTEGSDNIEFRYGAMDNVTAPLPSATDTVTVGFENAGGTLAREIAGSVVGSGNVAINGVFAASANPCVIVCDTIDFNGNGVFPEDQDVIDFFDVLAGAPCPTGTCNDIDFNNNGVFPEDQDVVDFFNVLAGGQCP